VAAPCGCAKCWEDGYVAARKKTEETGVAFERELGVGDEGEDVKALQALVLVDQSGEFDEATAKAVKVWQKAHSRQPTGRLDAPSLDLARQLTQPA
jgi:peptidoglycan hydrolase-like protein with peptidoglycan-binding domain